MREPSDRIQKFYGSWVDGHGGRGAVGEIAAWLAEGDLNPHGYHTIVERYGVAHDAGFRLDVLDLILGYVDHVAAGTLTTDDAVDIRALRIALHVQDDDFFKHRAAEVSALLQKSLESILADGAIDEDEDLYLVEIQAAFGLSYDQYLTLARPALERAMFEIRYSRSQHESERWTITTSDSGNLISLETTYQLAVRQHRSLGALF